MYIISKFHDYYDGVARGQVDKRIVFNRKEDEIKVDKYEKILSSFPFEYLNCNLGKQQYYSYIRYLFFCGKVYPFFIGETKDNTCIGEYRSYSQPTIKTYVYDVELIRSKLNYFLDRNNFNSNIQKDYTKYHILYKTPIFILSRKCGEYYINTNPNLNNMDFAKIFPPVQAYQEISHFLGNVLLNRDPNPRPISDKQKVLAAGFDNKISFRRESHQRKGNKND